MKTLLITYDLVGTDATSANYQNLIAAIKGIGGWAKVQDSVWSVVTDQTPDQVFKQLTQHMHESDRLFVIRTRREASWRGSGQQVDDWLQANLTD